MSDCIRALTNMSADEKRAEIYQCAADNTGFPCWIERYPMPKHAGDFPADSRGYQFLRTLAMFSPEMAEDFYEPALCAGMWSLWTEWGDRDHSPFWREVERLEKIAGLKP